VAAGSGLVAIAAARSGAARVFANDIDPMAVAAIGLNSAVNGVGVTVIDGDLLTSAAGAAAGSDDASDLGAELVVVGDAFYERRMAHRILTYLRGARDAGARVLVGDPGRSYLPSVGLRAVGHYVVPVWAGLEDVDVKPTTVWELC
jgi:predicted nicotinamide N-methyase